MGVPFGVTRMAVGFFARDSANTFRVAATTSATRIPLMTSSAQV